MRIPVSPHSCQQLVFMAFSSLAVLVDGEFFLPLFLGGGRGTYVIFRFITSYIKTLLELE